ncbi:O-antigen ligase [Caulobacter sp. S45]|uniref:O-antigen ligase family protein n=1 Tax=Caulobacter sp. S45 TaxID=1641861 RepID=UPI00131ABF17|nr:O-antigen ligase family protein [Caulobacter sp. S45]
MDQAVIFISFILMLFAPQVRTVGLALLIVLWIAFLALRYKDMLSVIKSSWPILIAPLITIASIFWSAAPSDTIRGALELTLTVAFAMYLGGIQRPAIVLTPIASALGFFVLVSVAFGKSVGWGAHGAEAFAGLNGGKNFFAYSAALAILLSLVMFLEYITRPRLSTMGATVMAMWFAAAALFSLPLYLAHSAGAMVNIALTIIIMFTIVFTLKFSRSTFAFLILIGVLVAIPILAIVLMDPQAVMDTLLRSAGKGADLTGRAQLWWRAGRLMAERPLFGYGFDGFWKQGNPDAEAMWQIVGVTSRGGITFHNTIIDCRMAFGWVGTIMIVGLFLFVGFKLVVRALLTSEWLSIAYLAMYFSFLARAPLETVLPLSQFSYEAVLIIAMGAYAFTPIRKSKSAALARTSSERLSTRSFALLRNASLARERVRGT